MGRELLDSQLRTFSELLQKKLFNQPSKW